MPTTVILPWIRESLVEETLIIMPTPMILGVSGGGGAERTARTERDFVCSNWRMG